MGTMNVIHSALPICQDKALEEIDDERASTSSEYETDEEWEQERKQKQAVVLKDQVGLFVIQYIIFK